VLIEASAKNPRLTEIEENARRKGIDVRKVNTQALDGVGGSVRHQGVAARYQAARTYGENELEGLVEAAEGKALLLILDEVQDPHNLGACLRSAAAAGATAVIIPKDKSATVNATVRKTSAGAADRIPVVAVTNLSRCLKDLQKQGVWIYGLAGEATTSLYSIDLKGNVALVLGGAIGNLIDRVCYGAVVDFVLVRWPGGPRLLDPWPAFNLADSCITIGAVLLIWDSFRRSRVKT